MKLGVDAPLLSSHEGSGAGKRDEEGLTRYADLHSLVVFLQIKYCRVQCRMQRIWMDIP